MDHADVAPPILVTGAHRSGTTWTANVLARTEGTALVGREPFNTGPRQWALGGLLPVDYAHVPGLDVATAERRYRRVLRGRVPQLVGRQGRRQLDWLLPWREPRILVKDPLAAMSVRWLVDTFGMRAVVVVRHPASFAASVSRMDWSFDWRAFTSQPALLAGPLRDAAGDVADPPDDPWAQLGLLWRCVYGALAEQDRGDLVFVRHEDLATDPARAFADLAARLDLPWDDATETRMRALTEGADTRRDGVHDLARDSRAIVAAAPDELGPDERRRVVEMAAPVVDRWYP